MTRKKLIVLSVATACAWPMLVQAIGVGSTYEAGHWEVITPSSVDESAPHLAFSRSHLGTPRAAGSIQASVSAPQYTEAAAVGATSEASMTSVTGDKRQRTAARRMSLPNPQTPWSPNESGPNHYSEDMRSYARHVAAVEQARVAAAASYVETPVASAETSPAVAASAVGSTTTATESAVAGVGGTAAAASATTPVASTETSAEIDRLLRDPSAPADREREPVASVNPALVDTRQPGTTDLRPESSGNANAAPDASASIPEPQAQALPATATTEAAGATTTVAATNVVDLTSPAAPSITTSPIASGSTPEAAPSTSATAASESSTVR